MKFLTHQPLLISIDGSMSSAQMISLCGFYSVDPEVNKEFGFDGSESALTRVEIRLVCIEVDFTPNETRDYISRAGLAPCNFRHLLSFGGQFQTLYEGLDVLALCACGFKGFPMLSGKKHKRSLCFHMVPKVTKSQYLLVKSSPLM